MAAPWIGISFGDATGIGPEISLKALASELPRDDYNYLLIGDKQLLQSLSEQLGLRLESDRGPVAILLIERAEPPSVD